MKRYLLTIVTLVICINAIGRDDVTKLARNYDNNNPAMFWYKLGTEHPQIKNMKKAIDQKKPAMQIVAQALGDLSSLRPRARNLASKDSKYVELINHMYEITGIRNVYSQVEFFVVDNSEMDACMYPEGTCFINTGLIEKASDLGEVVGAVAHEIAHFVLWHTINDCWRTAKAIQRNQTWAGIGTIVAMGAYGASQINSAQYGVSQSNQAQQQMYNNIASAGIRIREEIGLRTDIFTRLRYERETEEEADETAFWFLEKNGFDPIHLINLYKKIDAQTPSYLKQKKNEKYSNHPIMSNRIKNLEAMYKKFHNPGYIQNNILENNKNKDSSVQKEYSGSTVFVDIKGRFHASKKCKTLKKIGLAFTINTDRLTAEPEICMECKDETILQEIREKLKTNK